MLTPEAKNDLRPVLERLAAILERIATALKFKLAT